jgi:uncharacterized protein
MGDTGTEARPAGAPPIGAEPLKASPVNPSERIVSLDVLRGFAVLGILIMNVQSFSMIMASYINPSAFGDLTGLNRVVWTLSHVLADEKFMAIFSMLFGAGILMIAGRAEEKGLSAWSVHGRRSLWLIVFGLLHAYLLWYGDILVTYGICGLIVFAFRKARPGRLLISGLLVASVASLLYLGFGYSMQYWPPEATENLMRSWLPDAEHVAEEIAAYQGGWLDQMSIRIPASMSLQTFVFLIWQGWRVTGLMLIGMALLKWGVLSAARSRRFYLTSMLIGFLAGYPLILLGVYRNFAAGWMLEYSMFYGPQLNYWGSILVAFGYVCMVMLLAQAARTGVLTRAFAATGRMAFTNYIMQTLICTAVFYGHGLGLYARMERKEQILLVFSIWILQLVISPVWLKHFRFGPLEWLWRSLTYGCRQPMRITGADAGAGPDGK